MTLILKDLYAIELKENTDRSKSNEKLGFRC